MYEEGGGLNQQQLRKYRGLEEEGWGEGLQSNTGNTKDIFMLAILFWVRVELIRELVRLIFSVTLFVDITCQPAGGRRLG